ncbi:MAG: hypothetical protein WCL14_01565 [Bacteroidota bacterium]
MSRYEGKNIKSNIEFKKNHDEREHVVFTMKSMIITKEYIPDDVNMLFINEEDIEWSALHSVLIFPDNDVMRKIEIKMGVTLVYKENVVNKKIVSLECVSVFDVTNKIKENTKLDAIQAIFDFTNWALQGIYCSKLAGSSLSMMIPPEINTSVKDGYFLSQIRNDWN